jgi:bifunctional non-homologous end joining protein LigD
LVRLAAQSLKEVLEEIGLTAFLMTTGSRGVHVVSPLDRSCEFEEVRKVARTIATHVSEKHRGRLTTELRKKERRGRLFIDTTRNAYAQTAVPPYAVRARKGAPVATPLSWSELGKQNLHAQRYNVTNLFRRLGQIEDPWSNIAEKAAAITDAGNQLGRLA